MTTRDARQPRLMIVSGTYPPAVGGSPILLSNLVECYPGEVFVATQQHPHGAEDLDFQPTCPVHRMWIPRARYPYRVYQRFFQFGPLTMWRSWRFLRRQVARHQPTVILSSSTTPSLFIGAFRVAREAGIPFYTHMHPLWEETCRPGSDEHRLAIQWEKIILTGSRRVLCLTEAQADFYRKKYGISPQLLPHTMPPRTLAEAPKAMLAATLSPRTVLFIGAVVGPMNQDSLRVLAQASEMLPEDVRLLFLSHNTREAMARDGIASSRLVVRAVPRQEALRLASACHVLIAPLSHKNSAADEVRTVFSTKLLEYLVSGRPILVFSPADSFHSQSAARNQWGLVVDRDDPRALADGIIRLLNDESLCARLVDGALAEARRREATIYAHQLYDWVVEDTASSK
jgi:glycosyltransferase involved in cell wall biosynthesis